MRGTLVVGKPVLPGAEVTADAGALARLAAAGDTAAMLLRLVAPEMARVVRGVMGPCCAEADDALQQSLVALSRRRPAFR